MTETPAQVPGSHDGQGANDNDKPYTFGHKPTSTDFHPFRLQDFTRLMILRSLVQAGLRGQGDLASEPLGLGVPVATDPDEAAS